MRNEIKFDFIAHRKLFMIISACILAVGLIVNLIFGVEMDVSFKGGTVLKYSYTGTIDRAAAESFFAEQLGSKATVEVSESGRRFHLIRRIRWKPLPLRSMQTMRSCW